MTAPHIFKADLEELTILRASARMQVGRFFVIPHDDVCWNSVGFLSKNR